MVRVLTQKKFLKRFTMPQKLKPKLPLTGKGVMLEFFIVK